MIPDASKISDLILPSPAADARFMASFTMIWILSLSQLCCQDQCQSLAEVRALLQERQDRRKAELDAHRRDVQFAVGDEVLLDTEHTQLPSRSLLSPRWMGPFKVLARTAPDTYRLDIPTTWRTARSSTSSACGRTFAARTTWAARRPRRFRLSAPMTGRSIRCRSCSSSRCAGAGPTCW